MVCERDIKIQTNIKRIGNMKIFKEKAGIISETDIWVCIHGFYLYTHSTFIGLIWTILTQWNNDKNLTI